MPSFSQHQTRRLISTIALTSFVTSVLLILAWLVPLETRDAQGDERPMTTAEVWRTMLDNVPSETPFFMNATALTALVLLAVVATAYILVAILRIDR